MPHSNTILFPNTYQESRAYFYDQFNEIQTKWPHAELKQFAISEPDDLSIDWIIADPVNRKEKLILITIGLHGVEGFVGAAMLDLFLKEYLSLIDQESTGLCLVHALNPWGMANNNRFNQKNVDLNRNFMPDVEDFDVVFNQNYIKLDKVLNPKRGLRRLWMEDPAFIFNVLMNIKKYGIMSLREAVLLGQQSNPSGLYFSGRGYQPETLWVKELIDHLCSSYRQILHLDMHTGYGPSDQMSIIISPSEPRDSDQARIDFQYPLVLKADPDQFYSMKGDMVDWIYHFRERKYPEVKLFSAAFEFGTYGSGIINETKSLRTMIYFNQMNQHGSTSINVESRIREKFIEMYYPNSKTWRKKAIADCRQAYSGVFSAEGLI